MSLAPSTHLGVDGNFTLGVQWKGIPYERSYLVARQNAQIIVDGSFRIYSGFSIAVNEDASLRLGSGYINSRVRLHCFDDITIGAGVAISEDVTIRDSDNHYIDGKRNMAPILIGNSVWIGVGVTILKGVSIGDGSVIAAGAVVTRDVPSGCLAAGVPAKVKRTDVVWW